MKTKYHNALNILSFYSDIYNIQKKSNIHEIEVAQSALQELVDRATPMKPIHIHVLKQFGKCLLCNSSINIRSHLHFCGDCGQAIDWEDDGK